MSVLHFIHIQFSLFATKLFCSSLFKVIHFKWYVCKKLQQFVCLYITPSHYHHCANFIWRHWTYKMPARCNFWSVWVRLSIFSQLSIIQYVGLCVFSLPVSFVMIERIYILCLIIIIKPEVWTFTHCLGLGHETMVCSVCLSIFLWICDRIASWDIRVLLVFAPNLALCHWHAALLPC